MAFLQHLTLVYAIHGIAAGNRCERGRIHICGNSSAIVRLSALPVTFLVGPALI